MNDYIEVFENEFDAEVIRKTNEEIEKLKTRTVQQNRAMHCWIHMVAEELRRQGVDMRDFISKPVLADDHIVKEFIWKRLLHDVYGKDSTTEQTTVETQEIYDTLNKFFGEGVGGRCEPFHIDWPSSEPPMLGNP